MAYYAVEYVFTTDKRHLEIRPRHRAYLTELQKNGKLVLSGPLTSDTGGLLIFRAADEPEVQQLVAGDPYSAAGVLGEVRIAQWNPILGYLADYIGPDHD
ncbi:YciI family protein [Streptomyces sp. Y1]|uniref:YciI family protein n=1 Tax=Streptomyces sp. Y1 TaxID=3238634 RepID=A0AB39TF96_9ACTN